jgi:hypothetical protein
MRGIRTNHLAIYGCLLFFATAAHARASTVGPQSTAPWSQTRAFAPGQQVHLEINVGDLRILASPDEHQLRLVIQPKRAISSEELKSWVPQFDVKGSQANIRLHMPKHGNQSGTVTLYVPTSTALNIDLDVGDMTIEGISGDKNLSVDVGDLKVGGLVPSEYGIVKNSTGIGDVEDRAFSAKQSGWLGKSEKVVGSGKYHIRCHVGIGDIRMQKGSAVGTD